MRTIAVVLAGLTLTAAAAAQTGVVVLPRPAFPPPASEVEPRGARLELVSSRYQAPETGLRFELRPALPRWAPRRIRGIPLQQSVHQRRYKLFLLYGRDGSSARYLVGGDRRASRASYTFDFVRFAQPPNGGWFEPVTWAREAGGVLYVANAHLTYASATRGRNAYVSAIDVAEAKTLWRSPALVANARTFVVADDFIVSGYGFTAEPDFLYLLDRRTGRVLDRLAVPSAPEVIKLRGDRLHVRTYDSVVIARIVR